MTGTPQRPPPPPPNQLPLPVDRDWIKKLVLKSNNPNNGQALVVAPMVDQSDYPFRILARRYGANVTFTPMINAGLLVRSEAYQQKFIPRQRCPVDRPVIAQLCGHEPRVLEQAARFMAPFVDGIDLNCGCPQGIAKRGHYGAFLLEDEHVLMNCVTHLLATLDIPLSVKVRLLPDDTEALEQSMALYQKLVDAGIHLLTVHGRTRHQLHVHTGSADWAAIRQVVERFGDKIPIFANGNIGCMADVLDCFEATGADGVMSSEAILEYPALFAGVDHVRLGRIRLAREYLTLAKQYPPQLGHQGSGIKCLKGHVHRFLHPDLAAPEGSDHALRQRVACATSWQELWDIVEHVGAKQEEEEHKVEEEQLSWYMRHRITVVDANGNEMTACELKTLRDKGLAKSGGGGGGGGGEDDDFLGRPEVEDPDRAAAYTFFDGDDDCGGDY